MFDDGLMAMSIPVEILSLLTNEEVDFGGIFSQLSRLLVGKRVDGRIKIFIAYSYSD